MRFAIRDDDTCFFTRPEELERVYEALPDYPASLAVTPFALKCEHLGDAARFRQTGPPMPLDRNRELVAYLRQGIEQNRYSILCHGFTHEYLRRQAQLVQECLWKHPVRLGQESRQARTYLEQVLQTSVDTYVPPGNSISRAGIAAVSANFPNILATLPLRRGFEFLLHPSDFPAWCKRCLDQLRYGGPRLSTYAIGDARLLACTSWTAVADWNLTCARLELAHRLGADFTVAVHYWELKGTVLEGLRRLADRALELGFKPSHASDLFASSSPPPGHLASVSIPGKEETWANSKTS